MPRSLSPASLTSQVASRRRIRPVSAAIAGDRAETPCKSSWCSNHTTRSLGAVRDKRLRAAAAVRRHFGLSLSAGRSGELLREGLSFGREASGDVPVCNLRYTAGTHRAMRAVLANGELLRGLGVLGATSRPILLHALGHGLARRRAPGAAGLGRLAPSRSFRRCRLRCAATRSTLSQVGKCGIDGIEFGSKLVDAGNRTSSSESKELFT